MKAASGACVAPDESSAGNNGSDAPAVNHRRIEGAVSREYPEGAALVTWPGGGR